MKQFTVLIISFLFTLQLSAQITIERSDYLLTDAGAEVQSWSMATAGLTAPEEGADMIWDYSAQDLTAPFSYTKVPVSGHPTFTEANLTEPSSDLLLGLVDIPIVFYEQLDDDGYGTLGRITSPVSLPSAPITGGANDTITYIGAMNVYEEQSYFIKFPLAYQDSWQAAYTIGGDFLMTVAGFGLDNVPANQTTYFSIESSVVGHGTLILPNPDGSGSVSMEALLLRRDRVKEDSFFLAGQPAPTVMLDVLGLEQGATSLRSTYQFFTKGLIRSALTMDVSNGQVTSAGMSADVQDLVSSSRFVNPQLATIEVFPNPNLGQFQINFEKTDTQTWTLEMYNSLGQKIKQQVIENPAGDTFVEVDLGGKTQSGVHYFVLLNSESAIVANGRTLIK